MDKYNESFDFTEALKPGGALYWSENSANPIGGACGVIAYDIKDGGGKDGERGGEKGSDVSVNGSIPNNYHMNENTEISTVVNSDNLNVSNNHGGESRDVEDNKMRDIDKGKQTNNGVVNHYSTASKGSTFSPSEASTSQSIEINHIMAEEYRYALILKKIP